MRRAARADTTQPKIVEALRAAGASVWNIKLPTDLLVGYAGITAPMEVKRDSKAKHTELQQEFMRDWKGGPVFTVWDVEGALRALKTMGNE